MIYKVMVAPRQDLCGKELVSLISFLTIIYDQNLEPCKYMRLFAFPNVIYYWSEVHSHIFFLLKEIINIIKEIQTYNEPYCNI